MNLLLWIILGAISGWVASIITRSGTSTVMDVILGIVGALVGGLILSLFGQPGVTGFNLYSVLVSILGAVVLIYIGRMFSRTA